MLRIRKLGDPILITPTKPIEVFDEGSDGPLDHLIEIMFNIMHEHDGIGLAANQIGLSRSIFVYDDRDGHHGTICNPTYYAPMECRETEEDEGCLSIPGIYRKVARYKAIILNGQNIYGEPLTIPTEGLLARIFQHETDHLNGKLYISYLPKEAQMAIVLANQVL